ncbi:hypothetical protein C6496_14400 [Candidatus Poribacteria bacterium]|nr:MAG: hypothetical protein C6496_14400 [Candidatus Poribacteria bacterium]
MERYSHLLNPEMNEVVKEVREIRMKISEECGHDLNKLIAYYQKVGKELRKSGKYKFVDPEPAAEKPEPTESTRGEAAD